MPAMRRPKSELGLGIKHRATYLVWRDMIARCYNAKRDDYKRYGSIGVTVCERWRASFAAFLEDMGPRPEGMQIERKENAESYSPENCRWATKVEQQRNKRNSRFLEFRGERRTQAEWAELYGITQKLLHQRLKDGFSLADALTRPTQIRRKAAS